LQMAVKAEGLGFGSAFGRGGLFALFASASVVAVTGGLIGFAFSITGSSINPSSLYFGENVRQRRCPGMAT
jgi:hypothetical protein